MRLTDYKVVFAAVGLIGVLLIASPVIADIVHLQDEQKFSEVFLLGADKTASNYPFELIPYNNYSIYAVVVNHLHSSAYYMLSVKFSNQTTFWSNYLNVTTQTPSQLKPLYEFRFSISEDQKWSMPLTFSVSNVPDSGNYSIIKTITLNGLPFQVDVPSAWNNQTSGLYYEVLIELWTFNPQVMSFDFTTFVNLQLNLTQTKAT